MAYYFVQNKVCLLKPMVFFVAMVCSDSLYAECRQTCLENEYSSGTCTMGGSVPIYGKNCKSCSSVTKNGITFGYSDGGTVGINGCYTMRGCNNSWECKLFYDGVSGCTQGENSKPGHIEMKRFLANDGITYFWELICVDNTRNCKDFDVASIDWGNEWNNSQNSYEQMVCQKSEQSKQAAWTGQGWDIQECRCKHTGIIWYKNCTGTYVLKPRYNSLTGIGELIQYDAEPSHYWCSSCSAGNCPDVVSQDEFSLCYNVDYPASGFVACDCAPVDADYYALGVFSVSYPLYDNSLNCKLPCGDGLTTNGETGATSINQCVPDGTEYCDGTGCFTLGPSQCGNGG